MKKIIIALFLFASCGSAIAGDSYNSSNDRASFQRDMEDPSQVGMAERTDMALESIIELAAWKLRREGYDADADRIEFNWAYRYKGFLPDYARAVARGQKENIGDYTPMSQWLAEEYQRWVDLLGLTMVEFLHLDDINVMNYAIPVVFHMAILGNVQVDLPSYSNHWNPFCGVVSYWSVWLGCTIGTYGTGMFLICTPAATICERYVVREIAPRLAPRAYAHFWP
jgi:hypothetical protein